MDSTPQLLPILDQIIGLLKEIKGKKGTGSSTDTSSGLINSETTETDSQVKQQTEFVKLFGSILQIGKFETISSVKTKYTEIAKIFAKEFKVGDYKPREAERLTETTTSVVPVERTTPKPTPVTPPRSGIGSLMVGLGLLAGGLFAMYEGIVNSSTFTGLLKIISKVAIIFSKGVLEVGIKTLFAPIKAILKLFPSFTKFIGGLFKSVKGIFGFAAKEGGGVIAKNAEKGILKKILAKFGGFIAKSLKFIPIVGLLISIGFAYGRFKRGDTVGGIIDLLSGIASLVPSVGTAISLALDGLNMLLDFQEAKPENKDKGKGGILLDWGKKLWDMVNDNVVKPIVSWFEEMFAGVTATFSNIKSLNDLLSLGKTLWNLFDTTVIKPITDWVSKTFTEWFPTISAFIFDAFDGIMTAIKDFIKFTGPIVKDITDIVTKKFNEWFPNISKFVSNIITAVIDILNKAIDTIKPSVEALKGWFKELDISGVIDSTLAVIKSVFGWMGDMIGKIKDSATAALKSAISWVTGSSTENTTKAGTSGVVSNNTSTITLAETNKILNDQLVLQREHVGLTTDSNKLLQIVIDSITKIRISSTNIQTGGTAQNRPTTFSSSKNNYESSPYYVSPKTA